MDKKLFTQKNESDEQLTLEKSIINIQNIFDELDNVVDLSDVALPPFNDGDICDIVHKYNDKVWKFCPYCGKEFDHA